MEMDTSANNKEATQRIIKRLKRAQTYEFIVCDSSQVYNNCYSYVFNASQTVSESDNDDGSSPAVLVGILWHALMNM